MRDSQAEHLSKYQRTRIRYARSTDVAAARHYGVSVGTVRKVRDSAAWGHVARVAAFARRDARNKESYARVTPTVIPPTLVRPPKANTFEAPIVMRTADGREIPHTLG